MSKVQFRNQLVFHAIHVPSGARGELVSFTRIVTRGKGDKTTVKTTYEALFRVDDVLVTPNGDPNEIGKYFVRTFGDCNVLSLEERNQDRYCRDQWIFDNFAVRQNGQ
ncbi:hypothetical protein ASD8599_03284 [Ascidiaceihabitans donghaensis]|uniref:Uncharacterized protein n=2 Tax=Ascidiaceihabitans donghaensis TaxID=1510460 RepID=A0A2R8BHG7_9RHOB|nr:hypothetical protein ASD8599_03284 [Ascidiaceihabitans donghaensis]